MSKIQKECENYVRDNPDEFKKAEKYKFKIDIVDNKIFDLDQNKKKKKGVLSNPHKLVPIFYGLEAWPPTVTCAHPRPVQKADDDTSKRASFFQEIQKSMKDFRARGRVQPSRINGPEM